MSVHHCWHAIVLLAIISGGVEARSQQASGPIQITKGGIYSGHWRSTNPKVPAVSIRTDQPVILRDSEITSDGPLIIVSGLKTGANVTIENVEGTALDPGITGLQRGAFVTASDFSSLIVKHCSMYGVSSGIMALGGSPGTLKILNNLASNLEDRASNGKGGFLPSRPRLGHFIILNNVIALNGAEIAWNEDVQAIGETSTEDAINIYESQGSKAHPIWVHDNYIEGSSSPMPPGKGYTGTAFIADGSPNPQAHQTAYVLFEHNQVVATAGSGIGIAYGHDIAARNNRIVSCGVTSSGLHYAWGASAAVIWNYYKDPQFKNNTIIGTRGGMVGPESHNRMKAYDTWEPPTGLENTSNRIGSNSFNDPCIRNGALNLKAESDERAYWAAKVTSAHELIGNQHQPTQ